MLKQTRPSHAFVAVCLVSCCLSAKVVRAESLYGIYGAIESVPANLLCGPNDGGFFSTAGIPIQATAATFTSISSSCNGSTSSAGGTVNFANIQGTVSETNGGH